MMGVYLASFTKTWNIYQPSPMLALLFSTTLAPVSYTHLDVYKRQVNDRFGHDKGDEYIRRSADIIREAFPGAPLFRIGGDEFVVQLDGLGQEQVTRGILSLIHI